MAGLWVLGIPLLTWAAVLPLTRSQRAQVLKAHDYMRQWDEGALYPLLTNVSQWRSLDQTGAAWPNWRHLLSHPQQYRGKLFVVQGQLAGLPRRHLPPLRFSEKWDGKLEQWSLLYQTNPDAVAVIYLVSPPGVQARPAVAEPVRILCRFYKIWRHVDQTNQPVDYPVFIGKTISPPEAPPEAPPETSPGTPPETSPASTPQVAVSPGTAKGYSQGYFIILVAAAGVWWLLRRASRLSCETRSCRVLKHCRSRQAITNPEMVEEHAHDLEQPLTRLPRDPAAALEVLASERESAGKLPGEK